MQSRALFLAATTTTLLALATLPALPASAQEGHAGHAGHDAGVASPYADLLDRDIKALSPDEVEGLLAGKGLGFALPAELNGYPGPLHVLEGAAILGLTDEQRREVEDIRLRMTVQASTLGRRLVEAERALDRLFAGGEATADELDVLTAEAGRLRAAVRAAHLRAHIETRAALTGEQVTHYLRMRGYGGEG